MTFTVLNQFASLNISTTQSCYSNFNVFVIFKLMMLSALLALCVISLPGDFPRKGPVMRRNLDFMLFWKINWTNIRFSGDFGRFDAHLTSLPWKYSDNNLFIIYVNHVIQDWGIAKKTPFNCTGPTTYLTMNGAFSLLHINCNLAKNWFIIGLNKSYLNSIMVKGNLNSIINIIYSVNSSQLEQYPLAQYCCNYIHFELC